MQKSLIEFMEDTELSMKISFSSRLAPKIEIDCIAGQVKFQTDAKSMNEAVKKAADAITSLTALVGITQKLPDTIKETIADAPKEEIKKAVAKAQEEVAEKPVTALPAKAVKAKAPVAEEKKISAVKSKPVADEPGEMENDEENTETDGF